EILGVLERRILRRCKFAGRADQGAKPRLPSAADVPHLAIGRGATRGVDLPALCRRLNQHGARRGTRLAQRLPERTDGVGVTGDLDTEDGVAVELVVGWRVFQYDLLVIGIQFLGEDHGDRCVNALTHLNLRHYERRLAGRIDANERVGCRSEEHTSELQSRGHLVCRLLLEKKNSYPSVPISLAPILAVR